MPLDSFFSTLGREERLIVAASRREAGRALNVERCAEPFVSLAAVRPLIDRLYAHHVPGLVLTALEKHGVFETVELDARMALRTHLLRQRRRSGLLSIELERLGRGLAEAGVACVALKGASLALSVYASPAERFMGDLDLLVPAEQVKAAVEQLLELGYTNPWSKEAIRGYRTYHYHLPLARPDGFVVELHWDLVKPGRAYRLDPTDVIERSVPLRGVSGNPRMPCLEDQILHVVVQQLQDGFIHFSRTVDLDRLLAWKQPDWDVLAARARVCGLGPALAFAMQIARHLLKTECPDDVIRALSPGRVARVHLSLFDPLRSVLDQRIVGHPTAYNLLQLWLTQREVSRVSMLANLARDIEDHEPLKQPWALKDRQTHGSRRNSFVELAKLGVLQAMTYVQTVIGLPTRRGRSQMRFWSSQLSNSERL